MKYSNRTIACMTLASALFTGCYDSETSPVAASGQTGRPVEHTPGYDQAFKLKLQERARLDALDAALAGSGALAKTAVQGRAIGWVKGKNACALTNGTAVPKITLIMDDEDSYTENNISWFAVNGTAQGGGYPFDLASRGLDIKQRTNNVNETELNFCLDTQSPILEQTKDDYAVLLLGETCPVGGYKMAITIDNEDNANTNSATCSGNCSAYGVNPSNPLEPGSTTKTGTLAGSTKLFMCFVPKKTGGTIPTPMWGGRGVGVFAQLGAINYGGLANARANMQVTTQSGHSFVKQEFFTNNTGSWTQDMKNRAGTMFLYPSNIFFNFSYRDTNLP